MNQDRFNARESDIYTFLLFTIIFIRVLQGSYNFLSANGMFNMMCTGVRYLVMVLLAVFYLWQKQTTPGRIAMLMIVAALFLFSPRKTLVISLMFALTYPERIDSKALIRKIGIALIGVLLAIIVLSKTGLFYDVTHVREGRLRHSLGFTTPSACSAFYTTIVLCLTYANLDRMRYTHAALMVFFGAVIYYFTDTRIGLAIVLFDAMICCWCIMVRKRNRLLLRVFEWGAFPVFAACAIGSCAVSIYFGNMHTLKYNSALYWRLNNLLSGRMYYMSEYYERYGITLLGSRTELVGVLGSMTTDQAWFGVDNAYIFSLITFGVFGAAVLTVMFLMLSYRACSMHDTGLAVYIIMLAIFGLTESVFSDMPYNCLYLLLGEMLARRRQNARSAPAKAAWAG